MYYWCLTLSKKQALDYLSKKMGEYSSLTSICLNCRTFSGQVGSAIRHRRAAKLGVQVWYGRNSETTDFRLGLSVLIRE